MTARLDLGAWLTEPEAISYVKFAGTVRAFRKLVRRQGIPYGKLGRARRYRERELDAALESARWPKRRRAIKAA